MSQNARTYVVCGSLFIVALVLLESGEGRAYTRWDGCQTCHGDFRLESVQPPERGRRMAELAAPDPPQLDLHEHGLTCATPRAPG